MNAAVVLAVLVCAAGTAEEPKADRSTRVDAPDVAGAWQVIVRPGGYDGCGIKQEVLATHWLISQSGRDLAIRISKSDGHDLALHGVIDRSRLVLLSETSVQLADVPPEDKGQWILTTPGTRAGRETWLLAIGDGVLTGTRTIVVQLAKESHRDGPARLCLVEQDVTAKRP